MMRILAFFCSLLVWITHAQEDGKYNICFYSAFILNKNCAGNSLIETRAIFAMQINLSFTSVVTGQTRNGEGESTK